MRGGSVLYGIGSRSGAEEGHAGHVSKVVRVYDGGRGKEVRTKVIVPEGGGVKELLPR
jgi:hypothetical protein